MTVEGGPRIVTDGLVLYLDSDNVKSYPGEPTSNLSFLSDTINSGTSIPYNSNGHWYYNLAVINSTNNKAPTNNLNNAYEIALHNSSYDLYRRYESIQGGVVYTFSIYVKLGTATNFCIVINNTSAWNSVTGSVFTSADGLNTETFTRVSVTFTAPTTNRVNIHLGGHSEAMTQQTSGTVFLSSHQLESKPHMTPYIKTSGLASATRSSTNGWRDLSGNANHADLTNMTYDSNAVPHSNGTGYTTITSNGYGTFNVPEYTVMAWFKNTGAADSTYVIFSYDYTSHTGPMYAIHLRTGGGGPVDNIFFGFNNSTGVYHGMDIGVGWTPNTWYHVAATLKSGEQKLYFNGNIVGSTSYTGIPTYYNQPVWTGKGNFGVGNGYTNKLLFYSRVLPASEILKNYNNTKARYGY